MLKIGVIGAGHHSRTFHLPALAHYRALNPGSIELVVLCDRDVERAKVAATYFGFQQICTDYREMVRSPALDGCLVLTPPAATLDAARFLVLNTTTALLVEKPLGENLVEARAFLASLDGIRARAMVSMNRRFDPALRSAIDWIGGRNIAHLHVTMARVARAERHFMWTTGLHVVDAVVALLGKPSTWSIRSQRVEGVKWNFMSLRCGETSVQIDIMPTAGHQIERFEFLGVDYTVSVRTGQVGDSGWRAWQNNQLVNDAPAVPGTPPFIIDGTFAETEAFLASIRGERAFRPTPLDVQVASEICAECGSVS